MQKDRWRSLPGVREALQYCPDTGMVHRDGKVCGHLDRHGYRIAFYMGEPVRISRYAYYCMEGKIPHIVGHKDGNRANTKWSNLHPDRNNAEKEREYKRLSGDCYFNKVNRRWHVEVRHKGATHYGLTWCSEGMARLEAELIRYEICTDTWETTKQL